VYTSVSDRYGPASRTGGTQTVLVDAYLGGALVAGAANLAVNSGSVTDTSTPGVRRTLDLELIPAPGLFDLLSPVGTQLKVRVQSRYLDGTTDTIPMGLFEIDTESIGYGSNGTIKCQGSDRWVKIQRAKFLIPATSTPGVQTLTQISALIRGALGPTEPVNYNVSAATASRTVGAYAWDTDRDAAINDLAESIGCWVFFDRDGVATIAELPTMTSTSPPVWVVDSGANGILLDATRSRDRSKTYNVVVVNSDKTDGTTLFPPQIIWDDDPSSPTYAGTDPLNATAVGPFGLVPKPYSSPLLMDAAQAVQAGKAILARVTGLNAQLSMSAVRNHTLDALDQIDVLLPRERYDLPRPVEHHLIDKVVHPLTPDGAQSIDTRSTRTDDDS
jgi:hypothetical protein